MPGMYINLFNVALNYKWKEAQSLRYQSMFITLVASVVFYVSWGSRVQAADASRMNKLKGWFSSGSGASDSSRGVRAGCWRNSSASWAIYPTRHMPLWLVTAAHTATASLAQRISEHSKRSILSVAITLRHSIVIFCILVASNSSLFSYF